MSLIRPNVSAYLNAAPPTLPSPVPEKTGACGSGFDEFLTVRFPFKQIDQAEQVFPPVVTPGVEPSQALDEIDAAADSLWEDVQNESVLQTSQWGQARADIYSALVTAKAYAEAARQLNDFWLLFRPWVSTKIVDDGTVTYDFVNRGAPAGFFSPNPVLSFSQYDAPFSLLGPTPTIGEWVTGSAIAPPAPITPSKLGPWGRYPQAPTPHYIFDRESKLMAGVRKDSWFDTQSAFSDKFVPPQFAVQAFTVPIKDLGQKYLGGNPGDPQILTFPWGQYVFGMADVLGTVKTTDADADNSVVEQKLSDQALLQQLMDAAASWVRCAQEGVGAILAYTANKAAAPASEQQLIDPGTEPEVPPVPTPPEIPISPGTSPAPVPPTEEPPTEEPPIEEPGAGVPPPAKEGMSNGAKVALGVGGALAVFLIARQLR